MSSWSRRPGRHRVLRACHLHPARLLACHLHPGRRRLCRQLLPQLQLLVLCSRPMATAFRSFCRACTLRACAQCAPQLPGPQRRLSRLPAPPLLACHLHPGRHRLCRQLMPQLQLLPQRRLSQLPAPPLRACHLRPGRHRLCRQLLPPGGQPFRHRRRWPQLPGPLRRLAQLLAPQLPTPQRGLAQLPALTARRRWWRWTPRAPTTAMPMTPSSRPRLLPPVTEGSGPRMKARTGRSLARIPAPNMIMMAMAPRTQRRRGGHEAL